MRRRRLFSSRRWALVGGVAGLVVALPALAQDPRTDPETGQDKHVWPPDVLFDYQHIRLDITIPDMTKAEFAGRERLRVAAAGAPRPSIALRAGKGLAFKTITMDGKLLEFKHENQVLTIALPRAMAVGQAFTLDMRYAASKPGGGGSGMTFSRDDANTPEFDPMFHTQGQPESNHLWFAIHDFPNMRLTSEVVATVPEGFEAVSNGRLVEVTHKRARLGSEQPSRGTDRGTEEKGTATFHWLHDKPHASYLIVLCAGNFDLVNVGGPTTARPGLWMPVYGPPGSAEVLKRNFATTPDMVAYFEKQFGEPYPWDKYANVLCRNFSAGAMENSSCTTFQQGSGLQGRGGAEAINSHELCHQWFGDLVGYKGWEHTWLGEGWATYGEAIWIEHRRGKEGYQRAILRNAQATRGFSTGSIPAAGGMVSNFYTDPNMRFFSPADSVYQKGGWFLHSLRSRLGDETFWAGVHLYMHRHHFQQVETDDFRHCLEEVSGQSLERYFQQFALRPGVARIRVDLTWDEGRKSLGVAVEQVQKINADNPAYAISVPLLIDMGEGKTRTVYVDTDAKKSAAAFSVESKPVKVVVDPNLTVLCESKVRQPLEQEVAWWAEQLRTGPTEFARVQAAEELAGLGGKAARALWAVMVSGGEERSARDLAGAALMDAYRMAAERAGGKEVAGR